MRKLLVNVITKDDGTGEKTEPVIVINNPKEDPFALEKYDPEKKKREYKIHKTKEKMQSEFEDIEEEWQNHTKNME